MGTRVVTVPNNSMIVIDLSSNKITFTTWKILLEWNAVIKYVDSVYYSTAAPAITPCPSWMTAYDPNSLADAPGSLTSNNAIPTGRVYCK